MLTNAHRNRWACPGEAKRVITRSRWRVGWWEVSARLSSEPMSSVATKAVGGSCWLRNGRCLGARGDSCLGTLVPLVASWVSVGGDLAPGGTDLGWHGVAFGDDGASLGFGDDAAVSVAQ